MQAQGGALSFISTGSNSENGPSDEKSVELLAYINGIHEYILLDPHGNEGSVSLAMGRQINSVEKGQPFFYHRFLLNAVGTLGKMIEFAVFILQGYLDMHQYTVNYLNLIQEGIRHKIPFLPCHQKGHGRPFSADHLINFPLLPDYARYSWNPYYREGLPPLLRYEPPI